MIAENVLNGSVLVLNKNYAPINIESVRRAFKKLVKKVAEVVYVEESIYHNYDLESWTKVSEYKKKYEETNDFSWLNGSLIVPSIIRVLTYDKIPVIKVRLTRKNIFARDNHSCMYCGKRKSMKQLNFEHVIPKAKGGKESWENIVCACFDCNTKKGNRTPREAGMRLIRKPFEPKYVPTFRVHIRDKRYSSWKSFLDTMYWNVELKD